MLTLLKICEAIEDAGTSSYRQASLHLLPFGSIQVVQMSSYSGNRCSYLLSYTSEDADWCEHVPAPTAGVTGCTVV